VGFDPPPLRSLRPRSAALAWVDGQRSHRGERRQLDRQRGSQLERPDHGLALGPQRVPVRTHVTGDRGDRVRGPGQADLGQRRFSRRDLSTRAGRQRPRAQQLVRLLLPGQHGDRKASLRPGSARRGPEGRRSEHPLRRLRRKQLVRHRPAQLLARALPLQLRQRKHLRLLRRGQRQLRAGHLRAVSRAGEKRHLRRRERLRRPALQLLELGAPHDSARGSRHRHLLDEPLGLLRLRRRHLAVDAVRLRRCRPAPLRATTAGRGRTQARAGRHVLAGVDSIYRLPLWLPGRRRRRPTPRLRRPAQYGRRPPRRL
jgi:hypothetical protein